MHLNPALGHFAGSGVKLLSSLVKLTLKLLFIIAICVISLSHERSPGSIEPMQEQSDIDVKSPTFGTSNRNFRFERGKAEVLGVLPLHHCSHKVAH